MKLIIAEIGLVKKITIMKNVKIKLKNKGKNKNNLRGNKETKVMRNH